MPTQKLPVVVASIVALLVAITGILHFLPGTITAVINFADAVSPATQSFLGDFKQLKADVKAQTPIKALRADAFDTYNWAAQSWFWQRSNRKCQVVDLMYNDNAYNVAPGTPMNAYTDFVNSALPACSNEIFNLATTDWATYFSAKPDPSNSVQRQAAIRQTVARGTRSQAVGWTYLGLLEPNGRYSVKYIKETPKPGGIATISEDTASGEDTLPGSPEAVEGAILFMGPPPPGKQENAEEEGIVGFLPDGSALTILSLIPRKDGPDEQAATYVYAKIRVMAVQPLQVSALTGGFADPFTRWLAPSVAMAATTCPPYPQHNSIHDASQLWVYAGKRADTGNDAFVVGTSRLTTPCIPREGQMVRAKQDLKVFVGKDPHWPGVTPQGGIIAAGTDIRVVGDIAGYPFDATSDPNFCDRNPRPQKSLVPVPLGHRKWYCVYVPFTPG
jgi:hypothetical protein